jgi:oligosaccharide repeat unit polymerase
MTIISFFCLFICLWIISSTFQKNADALSPARVFGFVWCITIGLAELKLSKLQNEWTTQEWIILLIGPLSFLIGTFIIYCLNINTKLFTLNKIRDSWQNQGIDNKKLFVSVVIVFVLFVVAYLILITMGKEIPILSANPGKARKEFQIFGVGMLINNEVIVIILAVLFYTFNKNEIFKKWMLITLAVISFFMYAITLQRLNLLTAIIISFILLYYTTNKIRPFRAILLLIIVIFGFYLISSVRGINLFIYALYLDSKMRLPYSFAIITEPYMYIVMSPEMFAHSISRLDQFTYGYYTFDFITSLAGLKHWMQEYYSLKDTPFLYSGYNSYTAFWIFYRDFGILGTSFIGLLSGSGISVLYYSMRKNPKIISIVAYCIAVYVMMFSIVNHQLGYLWIVYEFTIIISIVYFVGRHFGDKKNSIFL